jgi:diguanylate cyclase (GGDEF)-like protein/PAS domain S-box-containing protein
MNKHIVQIPGSYYCHRDSEMTFCGELIGITEIFGYSEEEIATYYNNSFWKLINAENKMELEQRVEEQLAVGDDIEFSFCTLLKNGGKIWLLNRGRRYKTSEGQEYIAGVLVDITKEKEEQDKYQKTLEKYQIILSQTENIIFEWDYTTDTMFFSDTWEPIFGYKAATENFSKVLVENNHLYPGDIQKLTEQFRVIFAGSSYQIVEVRISKANGEYLWCRVRATGVYDEEGSLKKIVGIIIDIDDEKKAANALRERAERDSLTKLFNAHTTRKKTEEYLANAGDETECALLIIDLDNFKHVNDTFGHMFGDMVLTQAAQTIRKLFRSQDIVGRIGGDEFMVLMKNVSDKALVNKRCVQLLEAFRAIFCSNMYGSGISCSIGVAFSPMHGKGYFDLFRCADYALYQAKDLGKNQYVLYDGSDIPTQDDRVTEYSTCFFRNTDGV